MTQIGRPTKYRKEYDEEIVKFVQKHEKPYVFIGDMAEHFDVCIDTLYDWGEAHPSFLDAFKRAKDLASDKFRAWGCEQMVLGKEKTFNGKAWEFVQENLDRAANYRRKRYKKLLSEGSQSDKASKIAVKVETGEIEIEDAEKLIGFVKTESEIIDKTDIVKRVEQIEEKLK